MDQDVDLTAKPSSTLPQRRSPKFIVLLTLLLTILLAIVMGVSWKKFLVAQKQLLYVERQLIQQKKAAQGLQLQLEALKEVQTKQQAELAQNTGEVQRLIQQDPNYVAVQTLLEIEHLIREADLNLTYSYNIPATITLLQAADERAKTLTLLNTIALRQQVSNIITALQVLPKVDITGILAKLTSLQQQIDQTPLFIAPKQVSIAAGNIAQSSNKDWRAGLQATWNILKGMIVIRHHQRAVPPLIAPEQHFYLKQTLQQLLQQASWAVMQRQDGLYQTSLQQATVWIQQYYIANKPASEAMISLLQDLQKVTLKPKTPELTHLLTWVQQLKQNLSPVSIRKDKVAKGQ